MSSLWSLLSNNLNTFFKSPYDVIRSGLSCENCNDGISTPEKICSQYLTENKIVFEWEKSFLWSERKRYDFYLPEYNTIIEIHGGHHYKESYKKDRSLRDVRTIDQRKYLLAKQNGLNYIEINVDKNSSEKIFEEINITLQDNLNIISVAEMATVLENSLIPIYCHIVKLLKQEKDVYYISKRLGRSVGSIQNYIRKAKSKRLVDK